MRKLSGYGPSLVVLATAAVVLFVGPVAVRQLTYEQTRTQIIQATHNLADNDILVRLNQAYRDIAAVVEPSVVHVSVHQRVRDQAGQVRPGLSTGSGWVYDDQGHIVTNHHVIQDAQRIEVQFYDGSLREAVHVGSDPLTDVAVIKVETARLHPAILGEEAEPVKQGDQVFAFGSPFDFRFSMSAGVVSGKGRSVGVQRDGQGGRVGYENFIQVDAAINPGNSGGPLTDVRGRVIGMNTAIATGPRAYGALDEGQFAGIGLAIPIGMVRPVVQQIIDKGYVTKGYLGVHVVDRTNTYVDEFRDQLGFDGSGVVVFSVPTSHPAYLVGLRNDDIVTHINDHPVASIAQAVKLTSAMSKDQTAGLTIWRFEEGLPPGRRTRIDVPEAAASGWRNVVFADLGDTVSSKLDAMQAPEAGVRVTRADVNGPAAAAGLRRDDLVMRVNGEPVATVRQLQSVVSSVMPGEIARLSVWRFDRAAGQGANLTIPVSLTRLDELTLGYLPVDQSRESIPGLGIARMSTCTPEAAQRLGVRHQPGVLLEELVADSTLGRRTVPGSILVQVNDEPVTDVDDFLTLLRKYDLTTGVMVDVLLPSGAMQRVRLAPP